jgi:hypothetical protein
VTNEEQRQALVAEWVAGNNGDGLEYETFLEDKLLAIQELRLKSLNVEDGKIDMVCQSDLVCVFAQCMAEMLDGQGAVNLVEFKVSHPVKGPMILTLQRQYGKTPMDLVVEAKEELVKARIDNAYLTATAKYNEHDADCYGGCVTCGALWTDLVDAKKALLAWRVGNESAT